MTFSSHMIVDCLTLTIKLTIIGLELLLVRLVRICNPWLLWHVLLNEVEGKLSRKLCFLNIKNAQIIVYDSMQIFFFKISQIFLTLIFSFLKLQLHFPFSLFKLLILSLVLLKNCWL